MSDPKYDYLPVFECLEIVEEAPEESDYISEQETDKIYSEE